MKTGFTLVELVIVIVIVGILSIVAVPIYQGYVEKAKMTEGKALAGAIRNAQSVYYAQHGGWYTMPAFASYDPMLLIDARGNKYYKHFHTGLGRTGASWYGVADASGGANTNTVGLAWALDIGQTVIEDGHRTPFYYTYIDGKTEYFGS